MKLMTTHFPKANKVLIDKLLTLNERDSNGLM